MLEIKKANKTITEVILSRIVPISFCQVSHPPFKNPGSPTVGLKIFTRKQLGIQIWNIEFDIKKIQSFEKFKRNIKNVYLSQTSGQFILSNDVLRFLLLNKNKNIA